MYRTIISSDLCDHRDMAYHLSDSYDEADTILSSLIGTTLYFVGEHREYRGFQSEQELWYSISEDPEVAFENAMMVEACFSEALSRKIYSACVQPALFTLPKVSEA